MSWMRRAQAIGVLGFTVLLHEVAHALAARRAGGSVREVAVGFGPVLSRRRVGDLDVTLRAIPLGGFAAIDIERLPPGRRVPVLLAGPLANIAAGLVLRYLAGRVEPVGLPGQTRPVEMGGILSALALLHRASDEGARTLARAAGDINVSVGLANLLPLIPLDGGHLAAARMESAGMSRGAVMAFRQMSAALFLGFAVRVFFADLARFRVTPR